jgi:anaerobic ribonucleoside-triphosphate reductase activating protein
MLYYSHPQIVMEEVPDELSLALSISGCPLHCKGCHSSFTWDATYGSPLTLDVLSQLIAKNKHITCVLFYGGEWDTPYLLRLINIVKLNKLKTALFTGLEPSILSPDLMAELDILKVGAYIQKRGGLQSPNTNQRYIDPQYYLKTGEEKLLFEENKRRFT